MRSSNAYRSTFRGCTSSRSERLPTLFHEKNLRCRTRRPAEFAFYVTGDYMPQFAHKYMVVLEQRLRELNEAEQSPRQREDEWARVPERVREPETKAEKKPWTLFPC